MKIPWLSKVIFRDTLEFEDIKLRILRASAYSLTLLYKILASYDLLDHQKLANLLRDYLLHGDDEHIRNED